MKNITDHKRLDFDGLIGPTLEATERKIQALITIYGPTARVTVDWGYEGADNLKIEWERPQTPQEIESEKKKRAKVRADNKARREHQATVERELYEKLRKKFEKDGQ